MITFEKCIAWIVNIYFLKKIFFLYYYDLSGRSLQ